MSSRILIVEDHAASAKGLERQLLSLGHQVVGVVDNASDAIKAVSGLKPDLVFMDIGLEGDIDGIAAASAIRGEENIPVIFLTAHADTATLDRAMNASPFGFLVKPFDSPALEAAVKVALHKHAKETEMRRQLADASDDRPTQ